MPKQILINGTRDTNTRANSFNENSFRICKPHESKTVDLFWILKPQTGKFNDFPSVK